MLTPQEIDQVSFGRTPFGGYVMQDVDKFLEPLTEDYITLYKENALLKSKMKVLVAKVEEYRSTESSMKEAVVSAQKTCDAMLTEAEEKCAAMIADAAEKANAINADAAIQAENDRIEEARLLAARQISDLQKQLESCIHLLDEIKENHRPTKLPEDTIGNTDTAAVADEIAASLQALVGGPDESLFDSLPPLDAEAPAPDKFANLQFGKNYDPDHK